jgi:hypothetical protein
VAQIDMLVTALEAEYDRRTGFIGRMLEGHYDPVANERLMNTLKAIDSGTGPTINRRLAQALWMMPLLIEWNAEKLRGDDNYLAGVARNTVTHEIERILGAHP